MSLSPRSRNKLKAPEEIVSLIRGSHPQIKRKIKAALRNILDDPGQGNFLREELAGLRAYKVGRFRIIYRESSEHYIEIVAIGPRKTIYEETYKIIKKEHL
jgi:mRNA-degrading endonuclease RelE of RelBE toxin-antitoxin system